MTQPGSTDVRLPTVLDLSAARDLVFQLIGLRGRGVMLDASQVERLGGLCLQVLLSARATWTADGLPFEFSGRSKAFDDALALVGAGPFADRQGAAS